MQEIVLSLKYVYEREMWVHCAMCLKYLLLYQFSLWIVIVWIERKIPLLWIMLNIIFGKCVYDFTLMDI